MNIILAVQRGLRPLPQDHPNRACQQIWPLLAQGWDESPHQRPPISEFVEWLKNLPETATPPTPTSPGSTRSAPRFGHERTRSAVPISRSIPMHRTSTGVRSERPITPTGPLESPVSPMGPFPVRMVTANHDPGYLTCTPTLSASKSRPLRRPWKTIRYLARDP